MKIVIQKVKEASVKVDSNIVGSIGKGYMVLVGFTETDNKEVIDKMVSKMIGLRIFEDDNMKLNLSIEDVHGSILSISQFTLYANCKKGRRPSFIEAAPGEQATLLYEEFNKTIIEKNIPLEKGIFGADMKVSLINDGPVTIILDSAEIM
ncbi:MAG: D-aminoacyl-tRNA deacylase [Thomasclavelia sp.]|jgi:D-tyrosyl-tRNA(Tyr) deacylase|nr:D-aminoacyl-tRNA deacylase [Thomasclavelia sp.]